MRIAVDIGGTFTDLVAVDDRGQVYRSKSLTTSDDLARGIQDCLSGAEIDVAGANFFVHGSTVTINAVLERKGARTGLITTKGFRDVYEIGRGNRPEGYNLFFKRLVLLVSRDLRMEVNERLYASGELLQSLDDQSVMAAIDVLKSAGVEGVAVCLLHSYANPIHEKRLGELLRQYFPEAYVSLSHEILRDFREYDRPSTTVLNSYVGPIVSGYLVSLEKMLGDAGFSGTFRVMQSNGGVMSAETAMKMPVTMMESGPVAGVIAAAHLGEQLDCRHIISFDMGGTTAKASLIKDFHPEVTSSYYVGGYVSGHPIGVRRKGLRSARLRSCSQRGKRRAACDRHCERTFHPAGDHPAHAGAFLRIRNAARGSEARLRANFRARVERDHGRGNRGRLRIAGKIGDRDFDRRRGGAGADRSPAIPGHALPRAGVHLAGADQRRSPSDQ